MASSYDAGDARSLVPGVGKTPGGGKKHQQSPGPKSKNSLPSCFKIQDRVRHTLPERSRECCGVAKKRAFIPGGPITINGRRAAAGKILKNGYSRTRSF